MMKKTMPFMLKTEYGWSIKFFGEDASAHCLFGLREIYRTVVPELSVSGELLYLNTEAYPLSGRRFQLTDSVQNLR